MVVRAFLRTNGSHALPPRRPRSWTGASAEVPGRIPRSVASQCDAYQSYNALTEVARDSGPWQLVYCWTHVRRRFVKRFEGDG
ncbi:transposase [Paracoccus sp. PAMC 22219]|uniref:IS66 family transposase n=1 Tax=Paracoccus sp. PAMC 22219 TaxID=1569209 RepID=UPI0018CF28FB|nr:transposase [Paracoccus sp. PAMC 22219]